MNAAIMVKNPSSKPFHKGTFKKFVNKDELYCNFCKMKRHTKETCFKLHGYPGWFKSEKENKVIALSDQNKGFAKMVETPMDFIGEEASNCDFIQANIATMIEQGIVKFFKGKGLATDGVSNSFNMAHLHDFEGP
ncbi:hypothetical protein Scep_014775 [Stephania cephalantha]|uniref:Uncharacterized protein n=1 Tax=Stephania cephalantha TaxID=152367 RepID=A0AAP0J1W8_9MAGN